MTETETFPWGLRYGGFEGTLPRIRSATIALIGVRLHIAIEVECEIASEVLHPFRDIAGNSTERTETGFERTGEPENISAESVGRIPFRANSLAASPVNTNLAA